MKESAFEFFNYHTSHEHIGHLYSNETESHELGAKFILEGLKRDELCIYIDNKDNPKDLLIRIKAEIKDQESINLNKSLKILNIRKFLGDILNPDNFIEILRNNLNNEKSRNKNKVINLLINFESLDFQFDDYFKLCLKAQLNQLSTENNLKIMCQYKIINHSSNDLINILSTHPKIIVQDYIYKNSFYSVPKELLLNRKKSNEIVNSLTDQEKNIVSEIASGMSNRKIAEKMNLSVRTIETHRANVMRKLQISNLVDLVKFSIKHGLA